MADRSRRRRQGFLDRFRVDDGALRPPDRRTGQVGVYEGVGDEGQAVLIKVWPRFAKQDDRDIEAIWRHEIRQLHRMAGHPDAHEVIAKLHDAGEDKDGFYLVIDPGQRRPLAPILNNAPRGHRLRLPRSPQNRDLMWRNLRRIALALEALHSEGLLHRDLDAWSVLTAGGEEPDFQLTGFEWSMRLMSTAAAQKSALRKPAETASFRTDWHMFGRLAAQLIEADWSRVEQLEIAAFNVSDHLRANEVRLLRHLAGIEYLDRLDGEVVVERIDQIITELASDVAGRDIKLHLVLDLRSNSDLGRAIITQLGIDALSASTDILAQYVEADLAGTPLLLGVRRPQDRSMRLFLRGHDLLYRIGRYKPREGDETWEYGFCDSVEPRAPAPASLVGQIEIPFSMLDFMTRQEATTRFARSRGRVRSWEEVRAKLEEAEAPATDEELVHRALTLTLIIELLFAVAEAFPVAVASPPPGIDVDADEEVIFLTPRLDPDREALSEALDLRSPANRLVAALTDDAGRREGWTLTTGGSLGERSARDSDWKFDRVIRLPGRQPLFRFTGANRPDLSDELYLVPEDAVGRDAQLRRRLKALGALRGHAELLKVLTRPARELAQSHDAPLPDPALAGLDDSKRAALAQIIAILPLFLVQGPPGVGKTRLVRQLVSGRFVGDAAMRLLMSAQSNAAVDHLLSEVVPKLIQGQDDPLIVRCRSGREAEDRSDLTVPKVSRAILTDLVKSDLVQSARPKLRDELVQLEKNAIRDARPKAQTGGRSPAGVRNFEGVVMRAANLVFATTNSADLERLLEERSQFDWTIIEEAGKATGSELIAPQLLSHRRLMIGDHKQLPPFGSEQMVALLSKPESVVKALRRGAEYIGRSLRDETTETILDEIEDDEESAPALCARAIEAVTLFQSLIEAEFERNRTRPGVTFAARLNEQHRMHPVIAEMIAGAFYNDSTSPPLITHPEAAERFRTETCPIRSRDEQKLPSAPIVLVDMPAKQKSAGQVLGEQSPRWHNTVEREAVARVLEQLDAVPGDEAPTLAILSPYAQQVKRLGEQFDGEDALSPRHRGFRSPTGDDRFCYTVDSFQGSEADITIVSLVRNNDHSNIKSALGFLSDFRRMNVLLSRAKWRLILVGSFDFLDEVLKGARIAGKSEPVEFLGSLFDTFQTAEAGTIIRQPFAKLEGRS
ncbi:AAA domain-containing protein [Methylobacterium iners]|uniref:Protein kinase domain-containing protein n=1 Tax=Methylobacterium iners TaxID=418707 RepID=A0ABQ4S594_9HYPH|nr:AAA domain-containing protein [Methylobacterium iners]GJD97654.1 hypothetical protein OCOJLMKI_4887 [Methylobacterium iners]